MVTFMLNNTPVTTEQSGTLLRYLRDQAHLTSVKDGCSQGACGACMVLVNGAAKKACTQQLARLEGAAVLTLEGFDPAERELYARGFTAVGAVQCGFCTPGMIISAKGLLDENPQPDEAAVRQAIKGNICRCTGYQKIVQAILLIAAVKRGQAQLPPAPTQGGLGVSVPRADAYPKATGAARYADDYELPGMLYGKALRAAYARATVKSVDVSAALALPGVAAALTAADIPGQVKIGHLRHDYPVMIGVGENVHFYGDAVALVAAETPEIAAEALKLIRVEYEQLPPVHSVLTASRVQDAPRVHHSGNLLSYEQLLRGDVDKAFRESAYMVSNTYALPYSEHAFLEPECAVAYTDGDVLNVISGDQGVYQTQGEMMMMLGLPAERVRVHAAEAIGGGFGGKEDMSVQHHAALLAWKTGRPVKVRLSRDESLLVHPKRHAMTVTATTACDSEGHITALRCRIIAENGAYASLGRPVLQRACTHACGPYRYPNIDVEGFAWYTNNPPAGAFRGFGVTQSVTATEANIDQLAALAGIDPWQMRYINAIRPGDRLPNGQIAGKDAALIETLEAIKPFYDQHPHTGIACCMKNSGLGVSVPDFGRCRLVVADGLVHIHCSASCIGQGLGTVLRQMVCEETGLPWAALRHEAPDTALAPNSGNTTASRQTLFSGEATRLAARQLKEALAEAGSLAALEGREFNGEYQGITDPMDSDKTDPVFHVAYGYATQCVALDDEGHIEAVAAAHDLGVAVNPISAEGQIEGGVVMSLGYALSERFPIVEGRPSKKFGQIGLLKATNTPPIQPILVHKLGLTPEEWEQLPAFGAKGIGEIASIPTPAAVINAYFRLDGVLRTELPLADTPYSVKE